MDLLDKISGNMSGLRGDPGKQNRKRSATGAPQHDPPKVGPSGLDQMRRSGGPGSQSYNPSPVNRQIKREDDEFGSSSSSARRPGGPPPQRGGGPPGNAWNQPRGHQRTSYGGSDNQRGSFGGGGGPNRSFGSRSNDWDQDVKPDIRAKSSASSVGQTPATIDLQNFEVTSGDYPIDISNANEKIYKLQVDLELSKPGKAEIFDCTMQPKNPAAWNKKFRALKGAVELVLKDLGVPTPQLYVYDGGNSIYTADNDHPFIQAQTKTYTRDELVASKKERTANYLGKNWTSLDIKIRCVKEIPFNDKAVELGPEQTAFLDVLFQGILLKKADYIKIKDYFFHKSSKMVEEISQRGTGMVVRRGFKKAVDMSQGRLILKITACKKPFFKEQGLVQYLAQTENVSPDALAAVLSQSNNRRRIQEKLKMVLVKATHREETEFYIHRVHDKNARDTILDCQGAEMSVVGYFQERYKQHLKHPNLPLIINRRGKKEDFYPMELLEMSRNQTISPKKLTDQSQRAVVDKTRLTPCDLERLQREQLQETMFAEPDGDEWGLLRAFGVSVSAEPLSYPACRIQRPLVMTASGRDHVDPRHYVEFQWQQMTGERYATVPKMPRFRVINYRGAARQHEIESAFRTIKDFAQRHGIIFEQQLDVKDWEHSLDKEDFLRRFKKMKEEGIGFVFFVSKNKNDAETHGALKYVEQQVQIPTQHITTQTLLGRQGKLGPQSAENIIKKMNLKNGGINYNLAVPQHLNRIIPGHIFSSDRMYIGLALSHAGASSLYDRATGAEVTHPTTVGLSFTVHTATDSRSFFFFQRTRQTIVDNLRQKVGQAIHEFRAQVGKPPKEVFIYRGGVSEGEQNMVFKKEVLGDDGVMLALQDNNLQASLYYVVVIDGADKYLPNDVQNRIRDKPTEQNVPSGTAIRENGPPGIVQATLVPHKALIGTARTTRSILMYENVVGTSKALTNQELEFTTNALCWGSGMSGAGPTALPSPLYNAEKAAERGDEQIKYWTTQHDDASVVSGRSVKADTEEERRFLEKALDEVGIRINNLNFNA